MTGVNAEIINRAVPARALRAARRPAARSVRSGPRAGPDRTG